MKNKWCSVSDPLMLKAKSSENFLSQNLRNFDLLGALEIRGYEKLRFFLQKAHPCVNPRRLSVKKIGWGSDLQRWAGKKVRQFLAPIGMMCRR